MEKDIKTDSVFEHLYNGIKDGVIKSGDTLSERSLASELNVSRTPVREAFRRLEKFGLVQMEPHKGVRVISFSVEKVKQLYQVREVLEGLGARILASQEEPQGIDKLEALLREASIAAKNNDIDLLKSINAKFHSEIAQYTENLYLINIMQTLQSHISVCMATSLKVSGRPMENIEEHHLILDAIKRKDPDFAEAVTKYHVRKSMENVLKNLDVKKENK